MKHNTGFGSKKGIYIAVICAAIVAALIAVNHFNRAPRHQPETTRTAVAVKLPAGSRPVVDYNKLEKASEVTTLMEERKSSYGLDDGVDLIVKSDESIRIGDLTVSMEEILEKVRLEKGEFIERDVQGRSTSDVSSQNEYGIHVVQPGDNIWNIHLQFLKDYFDHRNTLLSPLADEPVGNGRSSGIGRILKFSENVVYIYNLKERKLEMDINRIQPLSKVVIYNMREILDLLEQIDFKNVDRIRFDGDTIWIPAESENQLNN